MTGDVPAVGMRLSLGGKRTLTIGETDLILYAKVTKQAIPLYNVLWAAVVEEKIIIDYAVHTSDTSCDTAQWAFTLPYLDDDQYEGSSLPKAFASALLATAYGDAKIKKSAYVLINPSSGPGGALHRWHTQVEPLFRAARMNLDVVTLSRGGEAADLVQEANLDKYDTIMACSGDGTPHEIFNGLARRPDAKKVLSRVAVSHIPCGSGNALALNLYGTNQAGAAALAIIKGVVMPLDLISITQGERRILSFLSQAVGIIAESDLATEHMRWMGGFRFEVGLALRVCRRRCYPCDIAFKLELDDKGKIRQEYKRHSDDPRLLKRGLQEQVDSDANDDQDGDTTGGLPKLKYGTVQDELPEGWKMISTDTIGNFYCGNMPYMTAGANFFPASRPYEGCMDLVTWDGDVSPLTAVGILLSVESGGFYDNPNVSYRKISAYRLIPRNQEDGYISIDGEKIPFEPFQAEIHRGLGRVISKRGIFEAEGPAGWDDDLEPEECDCRASCEH
ncbi:Sphingoid long chain base kinase 5 [Escovopsis weberi]|uniref:Sphingoid long chain base kinase 5 n=1 Tax=Escovopsis weberi TaxID=150374 RepID=A0A0M8N394_ESCWE|nr:Sphingoid long chain base kinase 5 [Escovopsis weberi]